MLSFQEKIMLSGHYGIVLLRSRTADGRAFFHYVKAARKAVEQMHRDYAAKRHVDFASYGEIVYSGWGENPTPEEDAMIKKKYGS